MASIEARFSTRQDLDTYKVGTVEQLADGSFPRWLSNPVTVDGEVLTGTWTWATHSETLGFARYFSDPTV